VAYRAHARAEVGRFPERAICGQDEMVAAKPVKMSGRWRMLRMRMCSTSHDLTLTQERFLLSESRYLWG